MTSNKVQRAGRWQRNEEGDYQRPNPDQPMAPALYAVREVIDRWVWYPGAGRDSTSRSCGEDYPSAAAAMAAAAADAWAVAQGWQLGESARHERTLGGGASC